MITCSSVINSTQHLTTKCMIGLTFWICCYGVNPSTPWNESIFAFILLFTASYLTGTINKSISSFIRDLALGIILLRAGLSLNPSRLRKLSWLCLRLAVFPCIIEAFVLAITTYYIIGVPFFWCMVLGFVCVATSPAIIVPSMINLQQQGYGIDKGIPTLAIGGSSLDDVLAITGFEVFLGLAMSTSPSTSYASTLQGPLEAFSGLILGTSLGLLFWFLPPNKTLTDQSVAHLNQPTPRLNSLSSLDHHLPSFNGHSNETKMRLCLLLFTGIGFIFLTKTLTIESMGPLGTLSVAFVAGLRWRKEGYLDLIVITLKDIWFFCEFLLFALIGYEVSFETIDPSTLLWSLCCLIIGLIARTLTTFTAVSGAGLTRREKVFISMAWLSKGTVQAAVGSIPLELARSRFDQQLVNYGEITLNYAILSTIISAPLGAWFINIFSSL
ncbi:sodium/hydrogen exchanger 9B2-like [Panonychus citri]|uniref:sodium/hydrogen exchanger 9B2-like n=1 Tax=Panonychus citri TaxID=50023 RepID=UPI00230832DA|nr:sodium/hydrogen exchanger 9B2-like [Panonychus citri]